MNIKIKIIAILLLLSFTVAPALALTLEFSASDTSVQVGDTVELTARLMNGSLPVNNTLLSFTTEIGTLSSSSSTTNASGIAVVSLNSTLSGTSLINASAGADINSTTVTFVPAPVTDLMININDLTPSAGDVVDVNITPVDIYGNLNTTPVINVDLNMTDLFGNPHAETLTFSENTGILQNISIDQNNMTNLRSVEGTGLLLRINSTLAGSILLEMDTSNAQNTTFLNYSSSSPYTLEALYDDEHTVNTTSEIAVSIFDRYQNPISGITMTFAVTAPNDTIYNSPVTYNSLWVSPSSETTLVDGKVAVDFTTDKRAGENIVRVDALNTSLFMRISVIGLADIGTDLSLNATPLSCYANNEDAYRLAAQVIDQFENPLLPDGYQIKEQILFDSSAGSTLIPLNNYGTATTIVGPTPYVENITVTATYRNESGYTNINASKLLVFEAGPLARYNFYANPTIVLTENISGNHDSVLAITTLDEWGHALEFINVTLINTNTSLGTLSTDSGNETNIINITTDSDGRATAKFTSAGQVGNCTINATNGIINSSLVVEIRDQPFISTYISAEPFTVDSGDVVNITTVISVEGELPVSRSAAASMLVLDRSGSMDPDYYAGTPTDVILVMDRSGSMEFLGTDPQQPLTDSKTAAKTFMENLVSNVEVGVVSFSSSSTVDQQPLALNLTTNKNKLHNAIDSMHAADGTAIGDAMADANTLLINGRSDAKKVMVVLTDGVATAGSDRDGTSAVNTANSNNIRIYTIGLGSSEYIDEQMLRRVASETGGNYFNAPSSAELQAVYNAIAKEISDFDVTEISYGDAGFTPYSYTFESNLTLTSSNSPYIMKYDAWDIDGTSEDCTVYVNGNLAFELSTTGNNKWGSFEQDISSDIVSGANTITIYNSHDYTNSIKNVEIFANGIRLASVPSETTYTNAAPYILNFNSSYYGYEAQILVNESINDIKAKVDWNSDQNDLDIRMVAPSNTAYGKGDSTSGYYTDERVSKGVSVRDAVFDTYLYSGNSGNNYETSDSLYVTDDFNTAGDQAVSIMNWKLPSEPTYNSTITSVTLYMTGMSEPNSGYDAGSNNRAITVYDVLTPYSSPTWNNNVTSQTWSSGSFSASDRDSYPIDTLSLSSSVAGDVVELNITNSLWNSDRTAEWGEECNIVLVGSNYGGTDADRSIDRFASTNTDATAHENDLNGWRPMLLVEYSIAKDTSEFVWVQPTSGEYPDTDMVETGNWTVQISSYTASEPFTVTTFIDKKSATQIASKAFISSFDSSRGDLSGLVLYSDDNTVTSDNQASYIYNNSKWDSYFTPVSDAIYSFKLSWMDGSNLSLSLYEGADELGSSQATSGTVVVNSSLISGNDYHIVVNKPEGTENDTLFTINATSTQLRTSMAAYYDSSSSGVPRYRVWDGSQWSNEGSANYVGGSIRQLMLEESPTRDEVILGTGDYYRDFNVQVWDGSTWGSTQQFSSNLDSSTTRGFDIAYESQSGDALAVYMDKLINDGVARYRIWNGVIWSPASSTDPTNPGANDVRWVELASDPVSDEIILVTLDDYRDMRAQVWDGSSWGNPVIITNTAAAYAYQCFDVIYEQQSGRAMVIWAEGNGEIHSRIWNGASWEGETTIFDLGSPLGYWIKITADPNSNNAIIGIEDSYKDIHISVWNSVSWTSLTEIETNCYEYNKRIFDVEFESESSDALVVWGDSTNTPKFLVWNGSSWGSESSASSLASSGYTRWVNLEPNPDSNELSLITSDGSSDINVQRWDGSSWSIPSEFEASSSHSYEIADIVYPRKDTTNSTTQLNWKEWGATVTSSLESDSLIHLENSIDTITADGLTAIDEGLYEANNELSTLTGNSTVVLMSDGLDNAGHHSLIEEALRAKEHNTVIHTVGLGSSEDEVDPILQEVANITGGDYYFAPNSTVLEDIFIGIASEITNFTVSGPVLSIHLPRNYITGLSIATATYMTNSTNSTTGNSTYYSMPINPPVGNAEPVVNAVGNKNILQWNLPTLSPGEKWGVWYQVKVQGAGSVPLILPTSSVNYTDVNGTNIDVRINYGGETGIGGFGANVDYVSLGNISLTPEKKTVLIGDDAAIGLKAVYSDGNPAIANVLVYSSIGVFNGSDNPANITISGSDVINLRSMMAGTAQIEAVGSNGNNSVSDTTVIYIRPKGVITLS